MKALSIFLSQNPGIVDCSAATAFIRARLWPDLELFRDRGLICSQSFRPYYDQLITAGYTATPLLDDNRQFDLCLFLPANQREENLFGFATAARVLKPGGRLLSAMDNKLGAARFEEMQANLFGNVESFSKNKCRVFLSTRTDSVDGELRADWLSGGSLHKSAETSFFTRPGIYGWNKRDKGSELLCRHIPESLAGAGADLGCGYGLLAHHLLVSCPQVRSIDLFEAEKLALEAARLNLEPVANGREISCHWQDVTRGLEGREFDWIVTNPPSHSDGGSAISVGQAFLRVSAKALRPGGQLFLVANRLLPYESVLERELGGFEQLADESGFKILTARR